MATSLRRLPSMTSKSSLVITVCSMSWFSSTRSNCLVSRSSAACWSRWTRPTSFSIASCALVTAPSTVATAGTTWSSRDCTPRCSALSRSQSSWVLASILACARWLSSASAARDLRTSSTTACLTASATATRCASTTRRRRASALTRSVSDLAAATACCSSMFRTLSTISRIIWSCPDKTSLTWFPSPSRPASYITSCMTLRICCVTNGQLCKLFNSARVSSNAPRRRSTLSASLTSSCRPRSCLLSSMTCWQAL
mmetsp:Transcript_92357/g.247069  ORF Transcript_92357/g.247069 Transcript_92357/m.247069 type:complete len:255 (-) Transcript_92357:435-1199(-)